MDTTSTSNPLQQPGGGLQPQSSTQLQQPGSGLQQQNSSLQITSNQTVNQINALDSGGSSIPLSSAGATTSTTTLPYNQGEPPIGRSHTLGLLTIIVFAVAIFCAYLGYGLLRQK